MGGAYTISGRGLHVQWEGLTRSVGRAYTVSGRGLHGQWEWLTGFGDGVPIVVIAENNEELVNR